MSAVTRQTLKSWKQVSGIYRIVNRLDGKFYIGSAVNLQLRLSNHMNMLKKGTHPNPHLMRAWNRDLAESFAFEVVETVDEKTDVIGREQWWLDTTEAVKLGYNMAPNAVSKLGTKFSDESKARMSASQLALNKKLTPEHKAAFCAHGRVRSDSTRARMSAARKGKPKTGDHLALILARNAAGIGSKASEETKAKMRAAHAGRKGIPHTPETKEKLRLATIAFHAAKRLALEAVTP